MASLPLLRLSSPLGNHKTPVLHLPHSLKLTSPILRPLSHKPITRSKIHITCSYTPTPATDRLISAASYFLPFINGLQYGRFLFTKYPILSIPFQPLLPLLSLYHSIPYASFISFFGLYLGVVRNPSLSRYARFNAIQALVLDVLLAVPMLVQRIISPGRSGMAVKLTGWAHSAIFLFVFACFVYGVMSSVFGKTPYLPFVADAASRQLEE